MVVFVGDVHVALAVHRDAGRAAELPVACAFLFAASNEASMINGSMITVDGGSAL